MYLNKKDNVKLLLEFDTNIIRKIKYETFC
jgi:hypothetical protein